MIKNAFKLISYVFFPKRCNLCSEVIDINRTQCSLCEQNERILGEVCDKCGFSKEDCVCKDNTPKPAYKSVVAPFYYNSGVVRAVHRLKFYKYGEIAEEMAKEMLTVVNKKYNDVDFDLVTFVPATKRRVRQRGYNQAKLIADNLCEMLNVDCVKTLDKIRETDSQRTLSAQERRMNLYGAFDLSRGINVDGKTILLIDDVKTTGSTLNECSQVLKGYGAKSVYACTFAITKTDKKVK